jgi:hypothetical protein
MVSPSEQCGKEHTEHSGSAKFADPASKTGSEKEFFTNRVVEDWDSIPSSLKSAKTVESFKNGYAHLKSNNGGKHVKCSRQFQDSVWTTPSRRYSLRGPKWATASQPSSTSTALQNNLEINIAI